MPTPDDVLQAIRGAKPERVEIEGNTLTIAFDNGTAVIANAYVEPLSRSRFSRRIPCLRVDVGRQPSTQSV